MLHKNRSIFCAQSLDNLGPRPDVELALLALRIGVERGGKCPFRGGHLALQPADGFGGALAEQRVAASGQTPAPAAPGAGRCRRASSRNAAPASARRPNSARSRRRDGRRCRPRRCAPACARSARKSARRRCAARPARAAHRARRWEISARRASPPCVGSNAPPICWAKLVELARADHDLAGGPRLLASRSISASRFWPILSGSSRNSRDTSRSTSTNAGRP